ncbi:hypothetical protein [Reinekea sp.]|jgi:hypothetical protein|uniref:hypothetical protein n=1 Tax=Reinekea sp. TaxID=1970455 RepID=UPI0039893A4F
MYNSNVPNKHELPSSMQLVKSTIIALVVAMVVLATIVLPAEFGIDPTGTGRLLGLTQMGENKQQLEDEAAADEADTQQNAQVSEAIVSEALTEKTVVTEVAESAVQEGEAVEEAIPVEEVWRDEIVFTLTPGQGTEYKLTMKEGEKAEFFWESEGGPINYDTHGNGSGQSISYEKGRGVPFQEGVLEAAFTGDHGWFFRNRNESDIVLILKTRGDYGRLKKVM